MLIGPQCEERKQRLLVDCVGLTAPWVMGDEVRLKQIIVNLLGNALKFTSAHGSITLTIQQSVQGEMADTVSDCRYRLRHEPGVSGENLAAVRAGAPAWLPERHGAGNHAEQNAGGKDGRRHQCGEPGGGRHHFHSTGSPPLAQPERFPTGGTRAPATLAGKRILAAEDNDINREILLEILAAYGADITPAVNGQEAVELFSGSAAFSFDVILMDIQMPVLDGYAAAKAIRAMKRPDSKAIPIFAADGQRLQAGGGPCEGKRDGRRHHKTTGREHLAAKTFRTGD